jgi:formate hydrogenlyase subunit 4
MVQTLFHVLALVALPPLLLGVINKVKAFFGGRVGPPLLQVYYDLFKLFQKGSVFSTTTTWVFRFGPVVGVVTALLAGLLLPLAGPDAPLSFTGDLLLFAYLLGLGRFFTMAAALDTGSPFEGMGAAREATFACLAEPVLFFGFLVLAQVTGPLLPEQQRFTLAGLLGGSLTREWGLAGASLLLVLASWFVVLLAENCRVPFDDPNTHLELTMIHEVMVLDHSGPAFGMILYGAALKLFVFTALVVRLALPLGTGLPGLDWGLFLAALLAVAVVVGVVESVMARLRLVSVPGLLVGAGVLSAFGLLLLLGKP